MIEHPPTHPGPRHSSGVEFWLAVAGALGILEFDFDFDLLRDFDFDLDLFALAVAVGGTGRLYLSGCPASGKKRVAKRLYTL